MITIYHNPHWGSSRNALAVAEDEGIEYEVVLYIKEPLDKATLEKIVSGLEDPVEDLGRKDSKFKKIELDPKNPKFLQTIRGAGYVLWIE